MNNESNVTPTALDVAIVGAGFSGLYLLDRLRDLGFTVRIFEGGSDLGGIWHWNCYPGARVDSTVGYYQLALKNLWVNWDWEEKFPGWQEMRRYFDHIDEKLGLRKDIEFDAWVRSAKYDEDKKRWLVKTSGKSKGEISTYAKFLIICSGHCSKPYIPNYQDLGEFGGVLCHTARWPQNGLSLKKKRIGILGTGASGIQVAQEAAKEARHLTVFQRTPAMCLPMRQETLDKEANKRLRRTFPKALEERALNFGGVDKDMVFIPQKTIEASEKERLANYERLWSLGGFYFWLANYEDMLSDEKANECAYAFWRGKVRERVSNPATAEVLAPLEPPHPFGTKRVPLEQSYYDIFNQDNVDLVDIKKYPIESFSKSGVRVDGKTFRLDILVLATGFDALTGCITTMNLENGNGVTIQEKWEDGVSTYQGICSSGFPNLFFSYGPQSPTAFSNGPTQAECQGEYLVKCLEYLRRRGIQRIEAVKSAEEQWCKACEELANDTLFPLADSWYMGANIPGKTKEMLCYTGGLPAYLRVLEESNQSGYTDYCLE